MQVMLWVQNEIDSKIIKIKIILNLNLEWAPKGSHRKLINNIRKAFLDQAPGPPSQHPVSLKQQLPWKSNKLGREFKDLHSF